jgi:energy-coupling factor transporter ATP-binding protein EcfA2
MDDLANVLFGDELVTDAAALDAFTLLCPLLEDGEPPVADAAERVLGRVAGYSLVSSVLDWWLVIATGRRRSNSYAYPLPDAIEGDLRSTMEALRDRPSPPPAAVWAASRRELTVQLSELDDHLNLEWYGNSKLPGERVAWSTLIGWLDPVVDGVRRQEPCAPFVLEGDRLGKEMKAHGIAENSRRWREIVKRAREAVAFVNQLVALTSAVGPARPGDDIPSVRELPPFIPQTFEPLTATIFRPVLALDADLALTVISPAATAQTLAAAAAATDDRGRLRLADLAAGWSGSNSVTVPALGTPGRELAKLRSRAEDLRNAGADVDDVDIHLLDYDVSAARSRLAELETEHQKADRVARLDARADALARRVDAADLAGSPEWADVVAEVRTLLGRGEIDAATESISAADSRISAALLDKRIARLRDLRDQLQTLDAPRSVVFDLENEVAAAAEHGGRAVSEARVDEIEALVTQHRDEAHQRAERALSALDTVLDDPDILPAAERVDIAHELEELRHSLDDGQVAVVIQSAHDLEVRIDRRRVARWRHGDGEARLITHLVTYCQARMDISELDIRRVYVALKTKPFVILAGLTGSGKSSLARLVAESMGATTANGQFRRIAVRPDWIDQSEILGFVNPLSHRFEPGWLAEVIRDCERQPDRLFFVLLDEMNLAPVEHYLAETLSAMEESRAGSGDVRMPLYVRGADPGNAEEWPHELRYPVNLVLIGTVNMDETTRPLSERVIDRANVVQLSVRWTERHHTDGPVSGGQPLLVPFEEWSRLVVTMPVAHHHDLLVDVAERLHDVGIGVGMRSHIEVERYLANAAGVLGDVDALDVALLQRFIPKVKGFKRDLREALTDVREDLEGAEARRCVVVLDRWLNPAVPDDEFLDGTDAQVGLARSP